MSEEEEKTRKAALEKDKMIWLDIMQSPLRLGSFRYDHTGKLIFNSNNNSNE